MMELCICGFLIPAKERDVYLLSESPKRNTNLQNINEWECINLNGPFTRTETNTSQTGKCKICLLFHLFYSVSVDNKPFLTVRHQTSQYSGYNY